jgi:hypothetical protein
VFYFGLLTEADDNGVFEWNPAKLRIRLRPGKDGAVDPFLEELLQADKVKRFTQDGREYGAIRNFRKWQRPKSPKAWHPLPAELEEYVALNTTDFPNDDSSGGDSGETRRRKRPRVRKRDAPNETDFPHGDGSGGDSSEIPPQREEGGGRREEGGGSSEAKASAGRFDRTSDDPKAVLFGPAVRAFVATRAGKSAKDVGALIGKWCRDFGQDHAALLATLSTAQDDPPDNLVEWMGGIARRRKTDAPAATYQEAIAQRDNDPAWRGVL